MKERASYQLTLFEKMRGGGLYKLLEKSRLIEYYFQAAEGPDFSKGMKAKRYKPNLYQS